MKKDLLDGLYAVMDKSATFVSEQFQALLPLYDKDSTTLLAHTEIPIIDVISKLNYKITGKGAAGPAPEDYASLPFDYYYFFRFGLAYAFEYWVIYDAVLRDMVGKDKLLLEAATFGCGTMNDSWSLAYARAKIEEEGVLLPECVDFRYSGFDRVKWGLHLSGCSDVSHPASRGAINRCFFLKTPQGFVYTTPCAFRQRDILEVFGGYEKYLGTVNVFLFAKVLSELPDEALEELIARVGKASEEGKIRQGEIYLCFSHSPARFPLRDRDMTERLVGAFNQNQAYTVSKTVLERSPLFGVPKGLVAGDGAYFFERKAGSLAACRPDELNPDFGTERLLRFRDFLGDLAESEVLDYRHPITNLTQVLIQVVKLTRKDLP